MDVINTVNRQLVKINEEKDIQCRPIPSSKELAEQKLYYCPKCKKETYFNLEAICKTAIAERKIAEETFAKQEIESKHRSGLR